MTVSSSGLISSADGAQGAVLPADGIYTVLVDGWQDNIGRMSLEVSTDEEMPGVYGTDQSEVAGSEATVESPVSPVPVSPLGMVPPGSYTTETWDAKTTEARGGLNVITSTAPGTASVTGVALNEDAARAPVAYATVTLTENQGAVTTTTTDANGGFAFINMPPGTYNLTISSPPLGNYTLSNDVYAADETSELTALMMVEPQTYDQSVTPAELQDSTIGQVRVYPSDFRVPPTITVAHMTDRLPSCDAPPGGAPFSYGRIIKYSWKYYILRVAQNEIDSSYNDNAFRHSP